MKWTTIKILRYIFLGASIFVLSLFSIFHFVLGVEKNTFPEGSGHISLVLDVSKSMNVEDMGYESRLTAAKSYIYNLIGNNPDYQYALTIFAGESQRVLPFTSDVNLIATFLSGIDSRNITKQGTNIPDALSDGIASFGEEKSGVLLLISDGDEEDIDISQQIKEEIDNKKIESYVVGVGTQDGGYVPSGDMMSPYEMYNGQRVIASLNTRGLKNLASDVGGTYSNLEDGIIEMPENGENSSQIRIEQNILIIISVFFWILFIATLVIEIYYPKFLRYE